MKIYDTKLEDLMSVDELFTRVNYMMFGEEDDKEDFVDMFPTFANIIMADLFAINNAVRMRFGKEPLDRVPQLTLDEVEIEEGEEEILGFDGLPVICDYTGEPIKRQYISAESNLWSYVPYEDIVVQNLLVWGIVGRIFMDDEPERGTEYTIKYEENKKRILGAQYVSVIDVY